MAGELAVLNNGFSIRCDHRKQIGLVTRLYLAADSNGYVDVLTSQIEHFEKDLTPPPTPGPEPEAPQSAPPALDLKQVIASTSAMHQIDPDLIASVIHVESNFNPHAVSPKGARGLMQLMPQTAAGLGVANAFDPKQNVDGGTRYLRHLLEIYNFDLQKALAAYNAGPERVHHYRGVPPYRETQAYVTRIILDYNRKKLADRKAASAARKASNKARFAETGVKQASVEGSGQQKSR